MRCPRWTAAVSAPKAQSAAAKSEELVETDARTLFSASVSLVQAFHHFKSSGVGANRGRCLPFQFLGGYSDIEMPSFMICPL
ncbi:MAG: hypothetical protein ACYTXI_35765 [Nostoc sp.]